ncbi:hypothetical protein LPJ66_012252 [Kickxella alabastrina]|uniref:Uncharacterized protein n=1 Tax=Kickxella alabastrina TaxID=61397 RepID=A0ACC1HW09_9FUNG|nr:hypothetical protein LPJ66_012252 [Kickxella alabastrina]
MGGLLMTRPLSLQPKADDIGLARRAAKTYRNGPQLIMPYLYLGGEDNAVPSTLQALGVTHILNVAREVAQAQDCNMECRHFAWDHNEAVLERYFDECFAFIDEARNAHCGVLVHCQLGVSRSASLVIAYVMRTMALGFPQAYEYVRLRAPCISPNLSLIAQLTEYGRKTERVPELCTSPESLSSMSGSENASPMECEGDAQQLLDAKPVSGAGAGAGAAKGGSDRQGMADIVAGRHPFFLS